MNTRKNTTLGALLCALALVGCEADERNQVLAPPLRDSEPVDVLIVNRSASEATLRMELPTGVRTLGDVPAGQTRTVLLDDADLLGGAIVRILSDADASGWFWVHAGSEVDVFLDQHGGITAYADQGELDGRPYGVEW